MKIFLKTFFLIIIFFQPNNVFSEFKTIKKKAKITKSEIIFPIPKNLSNCQTKMYVSPETNFVNPVLKVEAPSGYGLDD